MQYVFYFDQSRCIGCNTCTVACKDHNNINPGPVKWRELKSTETGKTTKLKNYNLTIGCNHCEVPYCEGACPTGAIAKDEATGAVLVDRAACIGDGACVDACPYGRIFRADDQQEPVKDPSWQVAHPAQKCTMCYDRIAAGEKPICVSSCINRALDFGTMTYLENKYGKLDKEVIGFKREDTFPNYYFKRK